MCASVQGGPVKRSPISRAPGLQFSLGFCSDFLSGRPVPSSISSACTSISVMTFDTSGGLTSSGVLQMGHGAPAPQSQASSRLLSGPQGRNGCFSQTQPVPSHRPQPALVILHPLSVLAFALTSL